MPAAFEVVSTTIDKYIYITLRELPPFFEHKHRIVYSQMEHVQYINEIDHPIPREYCITNTSERIVNLIIGTAKLSNLWAGIRQLRKE